MPPSPQKTQPSQAASSPLKASSQTSLQSPSDEIGSVAPLRTYSRGNPQNSQSQTPSSSLSSSSLPNRYQEAVGRFPPGGGHSSTAASSLEGASLLPPSSRSAESRRSPQKSKVAGMGSQARNYPNGSPNPAMYAYSNRSAAHSSSMRRGQVVAGNGAIPITKEIPADVRRRLHNSAGYSEVHVPDPTSKEVSKAKIFNLSKKEIEADALLVSLILKKFSKYGAEFC